MGHGGDFSFSGLWLGLSLVLAFQFLTIILRNEPFPKFGKVFAQEPLERVFKGNLEFMTAIIWIRTLAYLRVLWPLVRSLSSLPLEVTYSNESSINVVVSFPLWAIRRSKTLTLSIGAVDNATFMISGISSIVIWVRPLDRACPRARFLSWVMALLGSSIWAVA